MHGPDHVFFTCKDQKQGGKIIQFFFYSVMVTGIVIIIKQVWHKRNSARE